MFCPLSQRRIPETPQYQPGGPQKRIFLCRFWMKMIKPTRKQPLERVKFQVHPQMTEGDVKQYLEKLYNVPVLRVSTYNHPIKNTNFNGQGTHDLRDLPEKFAVVTLDKGEKFEFPTIIEKSEQKKTVEEIRNLQNMDQKDHHLQWDKRLIPPWFRI